MSKRTLNFDNFMDEKNAETIDVIVYGKCYKVKKQIPAFVPIMMARANEDTDQGQVTLSILRAGDVMFGKKAIDSFCEKGMSIEQISNLIMQVFNMISNEDVDGEDVDEATYDDETEKVSASAGKKTKK